VFGFQLRPREHLTWKPNTKIIPSEDQEGKLKNQEVKVPPK